MEDRREEERRVAWSTRNIAVYLAATGMGASEEAIESAKAIAYDEIDQKLLELAADAPPANTDSENRNGSYEAFVSSFAMARR